MRSRLFSISDRLIWNLRNLSPISSESGLNLSSNVTRGYKTTAANPRKETLYAKISPLGNPGMCVKPELDGWVQKGKKVRVAELQRIIFDLRKRKRFTQALEISEWMNEKGVCNFTPTEHAVQMDLIGRVHGFLSAEKYFNSLTEEEKTRNTYGALLHCYVRQLQTDKALSYFQKMKELGFASSHLTYNDMMCLYTNLGQYEKVPELLAEMKENKISPDNYSYRLCINAYGVKSNIEAMENIVKEMETEPHMAVSWNSYAVVANIYIKQGLTYKALDALEKAEVRVDKKDGLGYNHLISLYTKLSKKDDILRLWELEKIACKRCINRDYITVLESLVKVGEVEEAENVLKGWESSGNVYDFRVPNIVIVGYIEKGLLEKAEEMLEEISKKENVSSSPNTWGLLAGKYLEKGEMQKAVSSMKVALSLYEENKGWNPNRQVITHLLSWIGEEGTIEDIEAFVGPLRKAKQFKLQTYNAQLKVSIREGKKVDGILEMMKADEVNPDEETKSILGKTAMKA